MKKVLISIFILISSFMINVNFVSAANDYPSYCQETSGSCGVLGDPSCPNHFAYYLQVIFNIIKFLGPVLVLLMTILDLVRLTAEQKQDGELKKLGVKTVKRFLYAVILFVLPSLINGIFELIGLYGTCGIQ
ncbi:MAG: hypothetical protein IJ572_04590 [Bacilli bacterium]|nr:hypothetical protein [Bacilli bacterium]